MDGIRLDFRDTDLDLVRGANITLWTPYEGDWTGTVKGLALGLPSTGADRIHGLGVGLIGLAASDEFMGIGLGGIGGVGVGGGGTLSAVNRVRGDVRGFSIGIVNYAWSVEGVQIGVINIIRDNPRNRRVLPLLNW